MLKPRKRLTKRQIKQDKFVTTYFKVTDFINRNSKLVSSAAVGLVIVILIGYLYTKSKREAEQRASLELTKAQLEYNQSNYKTTIDILKNLVENYGGTNNAGVGAFYLANSYFFTKDFDNAQKFYQKYWKKHANDDILASSALAGIGACLEEKGEYLKAGEYYQKAAEKFPSLFEAPQQLMDAARCYGLAGEETKAQSVYQKVIEKYPKSGLVKDAELYLFLIH